MALTQSDVTWEVTRVYDRLFEELDSQAQRAGQRPSELYKMLDRAEWGLGDSYREWFEDGVTDGSDPFE